MKKLVFMLLVLLVVFPMVSGWGPNTHNYVTNIIKQEGTANDIVRLCLDGGVNEKAFRAGSMAPDITVIYYYSHGGQNYKATHNWNFQNELTGQALTDDERCFAYGVAIHLITDSVSHNKAVPEKIRKTRVPNWLLHPLLEKKYDSQLSTANTEVIDQTKHMLDGFYSENGERYIEMIENALGENIQIDVRKEVDNLAFAIGSFYEDAFRPRTQDNSLFAVYPMIDSLTNTLHPIVGKWNVEDIDLFMDQNSQLTLNTFNNWGSRHSLSPHGFTELQDANKGAGIMVSLFLILLIIVSISVPLLLVYFTGQFRWAFLVLLVIPILILAISIIYIVL